MTLRDIHPDQFEIDSELIDGEMQFTIAPKSHPDNKASLIVVLERIFANSPLLEAAREMRVAQKNYFAAHDQMTKHVWLRQAKNKEYKFDQMLERL